MLEQAGWQRADDGLRYRDSKPLEFNNVPYANRPELITIATAIEDQWVQVGGVVIAIADASINNAPFVIDFTLHG